MHIADGLETAAAYDLRPDGNMGLDAGANPYLMTDVERMVDAWVPLTVALNNMNRGMGQPDLYPFVLSRPVVDKLAFINDLIHDR